MLVDVAFVEDVENNIVEVDKVLVLLDDVLILVVEVEVELTSVELPAAVSEIVATTLEPVGTRQSHHSLSHHHSCSSTQADAQLAQTTQSGCSRLQTSRSASNSRFGARPRKRRIESRC